MNTDVADRGRSFSKPLQIISMAINPSKLFLFWFGWSTPLRWDHIYSVNTHFSFPHSDTGLNIDGLQVLQKTTQLLHKGNWEENYVQKVPCCGQIAFSSISNSELIILITVLQRVGTAGKIWLVCKRSWFNISTNNLVINYIPICLTPGILV